jgi:hypothetical protein
MGFSDGTDGRRTTFLLYKGYVHLENKKRVKYSSFFFPVSEKKPRNYQENKNRVYLPNMWNLGRIFAPFSRFYKVK